MIWYWIVFGVATTYLATGLIFREIKVERWRERGDEHTRAALRAATRRVDLLIGESRHQAHLAWQCNAKADHHERTMRAIWPFL